MKRGGRGERPLSCLKIWKKRAGQNFALVTITQKAKRKEKGKFTTVN